MKISVLTMAASLFVLAGCAVQSGEQAQNEVVVSTAPTSEDVVRVTAPATRENEPAPAEQANDEGTYFGLTFQQLDGNRLVTGAGAFYDGISPVMIALDGDPEWVVGAPHKQGILWVVVMADGAVEGYIVSAAGTVEPVSVSPSTLPAGMPPMLHVSNGEYELMTGPDDASALTHPVPLRGGRLAYVAANGDVVIMGDEGEVGRAMVNAIPDARLLADERERVLVLGGATERYDHAIAGDGIEGGQIALIETTPEVRTILTITLAGDQVVEGIAPIWTDITGDGQREIVVTASDRQNGAQILAFNEQGTLIAQGPAIGQGYRWRHQLAVGPFGPAGELSLVEVLTPHIGGRVGFYMLEGDRLTISAERLGFTSHVIGSRNLDMAAAGDFDGDGRPELVLPSQDRQSLGAIEWGEGGAEVGWEMDLPGTLTTNIGTVTTQDGKIGLAVGTLTQHLIVFSLP